MSKPVVDLTNVDGKAFSIIAACTRTAKEAKWDREQIESLQKEMLSGDYDHLLQVAMKYFDVRFRDSDDDSDYSDEEE